ncbi:hypothetical protein KUTeg_016915 [Tegillarca granosa]|uniref:Uncharacterized protein n=1 Tax=Tegillarca granosa TaxID=220873 RepID=A0ABQ9ES24_TEGGR|nr:hypothetical protein KUTeg_016915 [Tegillarca granosa]
MFTFKVGQILSGLISTLNYIFLILLFLKNFSTIVQYHLETSQQRSCFPVEPNCFVFGFLSPKCQCNGKIMIWLKTILSKNLVVYINPRGKIKSTQVKINNSPILQINLEKLTKNKNYTYFESDYLDNNFYPIG